MTDAAGARSPSIPADDLSRKLTVAEPDSSRRPMSRSRAMCTASSYPARRPPGATA